MSSISIIGVGSMASALAAISKRKIACDGGAKGRNAVNLIVHGACETGAQVKETGVGTTGQTKCTVPAGDTVILRPHEAEPVASV
ncbi:MAG: hypothetical protein QOF88_2228 [Mycobacterium sp.]|jgi:pyrroline-5-carboxylate reductase|nr:hypothetical protein [Mycobacterium sp.]